MLSKLLCGMYGLIGYLTVLAFFSYCNGYVVPSSLSYPCRISRLYGTSAIKAKKIARMQASMKHVRVAAPITSMVESDPLMPMVEFIAKVADERKANSIKAFRVAHLTEVTQFVLLIQGSNNRQISAITSSVEDEVLKDFKETPFARDGTAASGWFVLDYGSVIAHVMTPAMDSFYKLEKKWLAAEPVDLSHVISPPSVRSEALYAEQDGSSGMDDWGFRNEDNEIGGTSDGSGNSDMHYKMGGEKMMETYTSTGNKNNNMELPAEDVAFWGEELAEQMYLNRVPSLPSAKSPVDRSTISLSVPGNSQTAASDYNTNEEKRVPATVTKTSKVSHDGVTEGMVETEKVTTRVIKVTKTLLGRGLRKKHTLR